MTSKLEAAAHLNASSMDKGSQPGTSSLCKLLGHSSILYHAHIAACKHHKRWRGQQVCQAGSSSSSSATAAEQSQASGTTSMQPGGCQ